MPISNDLLTHGVIGPVILQGRQEGRREVLCTLLTKRFGWLLEWGEARLNALTARDLDDLALRLLDAQSLDTLFSHHG